MWLLKVCLNFWSILNLDTIAATFTFQMVSLLATKIFNLRPAKKGADRAISIFCGIYVILIINERNNKIEQIYRIYRIHRNTTIIYRKRLDQSFNCNQTTIQEKQYHTYKCLNNISVKWHLTNTWHLELQATNQSLPIFTWTKNKEPF